MTNGDNPIKAAMDGWDALHAEHEALKETHDQLVAELNSLSSRYDVLLSEHKRTVRERDLFQTYAIGLRTRLSTVKENILAAERETMDWVAKEIDPKKEEIIEAEDAPEKDVEIEDAVAKAAAGAKPQGLGGF